MHNYQIRDQIEILVEGGFIKKTDSEKAQKLLKKKFWTDRIASTWCIEDIIDRAKEQDKKVTVKQARKILQDISHGHDAEIGINWDVIDCVTDMEPKP